MLQLLWNILGVWFFRDTVVCIVYSVGLNFPDLYSCLWSYDCMALWKVYYSLSIHFSGHSSGEPGLAGVYWSKGWWKWWWQPELQVVQSSNTTITTNKPTPSLFTGRVPFLLPNQQCQSTEGKGKFITIIIIIILFLSSADIIPREFNTNI